MGGLIMTVAGGIGGFLIGGPMGASIGMTLGGMVGQTLFGPTIKGPRLNDLKITASTLGNVIPEVYGTSRIGTNLIWSSGIKETKHKSSAGKGGPKQTTYTYDATFAVALCKGPIDDVLRIWADSKLIYDVSSNSTRSGTTAGAILQIMDGGAVNVAAAAKTILGKSKNRKKDIKVRIYRGTEDQLPDSLIVAHKGEANVSAHRGIAYLVFEKMQLADYGNRIPTITVEVTKAISQWFPSIVAYETDGTTPVSGSYYYFPDWINGRYYAASIYSPYTTRIGSIDSMKVMGSFSTNFASQAEGNHPARNTFQGGGGQTSCWIPEANLYVTESSSTNSRPLEFFNLSTLTYVKTIGKPGLSTSGVYIDNDGDLLEQYAGAGEISYNYVGGRLLILRTGSLRYTWAFWYDDPVPIFTHRAGFEPYRAMPGRRGGDYSDIINWRSANNRLEVEVYSISSSAKGEVIEGPIPKWVPSEAYTFTRHNIVPYAGENYVPTVCLYDPTDDHIFSLGKSNGTPCSFKYSLTTSQYKFKTKYASTLRLPENPMEYSRISGGTFGWFEYGYPRTTGTLAEIGLQDGALARTYYPSSSSYNSLINLASVVHWDDDSSSLVVMTGSGYQRIYFRERALSVTVPDIVTDVCLKTGILTASDFDVTGLNADEIVGYVVDRESSARDILKQLATAYPFDGYESDYKIKFKSRGDDPITEITQDWLGMSDDGSPLKETNTQELELPLRINVNFYDVARDHQQGSQSAKRNANPFPTMWSNKEETIDLPISWTATEAKQCANKLLKLAWTNRWAYDFTLPWRYLKYDPTDVITLSLDDGTEYTARLSELTVGADFSIAAKAVSEKAAAYTSNALADSSDAAPLQVVGGNYPCDPIIINTPLLRDEDYTTTGNAITYLSATSKAAPFNGAYIYIDEDLVDYKSLAFIQEDIVAGIALTVLPPTKSYESTDEEFVLEVMLYDQNNDLESVTQEAMLNTYANAALVGDEIIQFRDATPTGTGRWHLTGILRARRGTNYAINSHSRGERFMMLTEEAIYRYTRPPEQYVSTKIFKAVPPSFLVEDALGTNFTLQPRDLMPWTPEHVQITDDGTDVSITAVRRSRVIDPLKDGTDTIHYREGDKTSAKIKAAIWLNKGVGDINNLVDPDWTGQVNLFDTNGDDIPVEFTFPLTTMGAYDSFLLRLYETGYVDGIPKWVECERLSAGRWNVTEAY